MFDKSRVEDNQKTFKVIPHFKDIQYEWSTKSNFNAVSLYLPLLPARTKYTLSISNFNLKTVPGLDEKLRMLNWNDKRIWSIECTDLQQLNILNKIEQTI